MRLAEQILTAAADCGLDPLVEVDSAVLSGSAFVRAVNAHTNLLTTSGLRAGDVCLVTSRRGTDFWVDLVAVWQMGGVAVPVDRQLNDADLGKILDLVRPRAVLGRDLDAGASADLAARAVALETGDGVNRTVALLLTSGSTGLPKAVELSEHALMGNVEATCAVVPVLPSTRLAIAIPLHFTSSICHFLAAVTRRAQIVATERPLLSQDLVAYIVAHGATAFGGAPLQLRWLGQCADQLGDRLTWVMSSGDHLAESVIELLRAALPRSMVYTVYGLTEVGGRFCILPPEAIDTHSGSVGTPIDGMSVAIRDEHGRELPSGEIGELYAQGPYLAKGYYRDPESTRAAFSSAGFRTGDLGLREADGMIWLRGRADNLFKVAGQKVSAEAIEMALRTLGFQDVAVLAIDEPNVGRVAHAFVVLKPGTALDTGGTLAALRPLVPPTHLPRRVHAVSAIPRTGSGKVDRRALGALGFHPDRR